MSDYVEFSITDGTTVIDLLAANRGQKAGFGLQRYTPGRPQLKDGGVWQDSPLAVGRQLVSGIDTNISDALTLICGGPDHAFIIRAYEELDLLLRKAQAYWTTTWQQTPVYLRARAKGETARRYALIHYAKFDEYFDPHGQLFAGGGFGVTTEEFVLGVERGLWLDLPPGESESVAITHDGNSGAAIDASGDFDTNEGLVIGVNHNPGLTHIYQFTASGSVFSANRLDGSPPYTLLGTTMAVGNILYLGADEPFFAIKFELSVLAGDSTIVTEFWNGSTWTAALPFDFESATPQVAFFNNGMAAWAKTTVNGHNKYWVRSRVTAVVDNTSPVQANRHIYAVMDTFVEVAEDAIDGTQDALLKLSMSTIEIAVPLSFLVGLRSYSRGANFQSNINIGTGNPSNITYTTGVASGITENTANGLAPGGASVAVSNSNGSGAEVTAVTFHFEPPVVSDFFGRFRLFAHVKLNTTALSTMRYRVLPAATYFGSSTAYAQGETKLLPTTTVTSNILIDLGYITLPPSDFMLHTDSFTGFDVALRTAVPSGETVTIYNIVFIPVDEWTAEIDNDVAQSAATDTQVTVIDAISHPKYSKRAYIAQPDGDILSPVLAISNGVPVLHANARQRLWFAIPGTANFHVVVSSIRVARAERYLHLRSTS